MREHGISHEHDSTRHRHRPRLLRGPRCALQHQAPYRLGSAQRRAKADSQAAPALGSTFIGGFTKYATLIGASAAVITLGVWAVADYLAAQSARSAATADILEPSTAVPVSDAHRSPDEVAGHAPAPKLDRSTAVPVDNLDPYTDPDFKVQRRSHHAGTALSLKETLLQRSEGKARADLLRETQQHLYRSQYDCEAADRAASTLRRALTSGASQCGRSGTSRWDSYKGATLPQCKDIKNVVDPSSLHLQSTVAQDSHP